MLPQLRVGVLLVYVRLFNIRICSAEKINPVAGSLAAALKIYRQYHTSNFVHFFHFLQEINYFKLNFNTLEQFLCIFI